MYKKIFLPFVLTFISFLCILSSCSEPNVVENQTNNFAKDNVLSLGKNSDIVKPIGKIIGYKVITENGKEKKIPIYDGIPDGIDPKALPCDYYSIYVNEFDHYEPKNGKKLGIWDFKYYLNYTDFYNKWGFRSIVVSNGSQWSKAKNAGFDANEIVGNVHVNSNNSYSLPTGSYTKYFIDEPYEGDSPLSLSYCVYLANYLYNYYNQAKLYVSSWGNDQDDYDFYTSLLSSTVNTYMMCDKYDGAWFFGCGDDQTYIWDWFEENYSRIKAHWISLLIDGEDEEFDLLFNKANSLGINELFLFADDNPDNPCHDGEILTESKYNIYLKQFCSSAFNKGWLRLFVETYKYMYHCPEYLGDPCYCSENDAGWELAWIKYMGTYEIN